MIRDLSQKYQVSFGIDPAMTLMKVVTATETSLCPWFKTIMRTFGHPAVDWTAKPQLCRKGCFQHRSTLCSDDSIVVTRSPAVPPGCSPRIPDGVTNRRVHPQTSEHVATLDDDHGFSMGLIQSDSHQTTHSAPKGLISFGISQPGGKQVPAPSQNCFHCHTSAGISHRASLPPSGTSRKAQSRSASSWWVRHSP